jgi:hypothetical protein
MARNRIDSIYDLSLYPDQTPLNAFERMNEQFEEHVKQFTHFRDKMVPDLYHKIYDLQKRYNDLATIIKEIDGKLYEHLHFKD